MGIATGQGLLVVDIDPKNGGSLEALNALMTPPQTALLRTGGGGVHLYFSYDPTLMIRNSASKLAPGIDIWGENSYVVAPPSRHASGNRYYWDRHTGYMPNTFHFRGKPYPAARVSTRPPPLIHATC